MSRKIKFVLSIILIIPLLFSCQKGKGTLLSSKEIEDNTDDWGPNIRKPNIYFYPEHPIELDISITFPFGGVLLESIPDYEDGWHVYIDTNGLIDEVFSYIFYECRVPIKFQKEEGWIIKRDNLSAFFQENMRQYGFNAQEIKDFIDYWIPILVNSEQYLIYPQTEEEISPYIQLNFTIEPQTILRLYYKIEAYNRIDLSLIQPEIETTLRQGFTIAEWGVIFE